MRTCLYREMEALVVGQQVTTYEFVVLRQSVCAYKVMLDGPIEIKAVKIFPTGSLLGTCCK